MMLSQGQAKEMDKMELYEEVTKKMEVLELCAGGILKNHEGTVGLYWAFEEVDTLVREMKERLREIPE